MTLNGRFIIKKRISSPFLFITFILHSFPIPSLPSLLFLHASVLLPSSNPFPFALVDYDLHHSLPLIREWFLFFSLRGIHYCISLAPQLCTSSSHTLLYLGILFIRDQTPQQFFVPFSVFTYFCYSNDFLYHRPERIRFSLIAFLFFFLSVSKNGRT